MNFYTDRDQLIEQEILPILGDYVADFDVEAIADELIDGTGEGVEYRLFVRTDVDICEVIARHDMTAAK